MNYVIASETGRGIWPSNLDQINANPRGKWCRLARKRIDQQIVHESEWLNTTGSCLSSTQHVCAILWRHLWPLWLYCPINGTNFGKQLLSIKCVFWVSLQLFSKPLLILRRNLARFFINVETSSRKVPPYSYRILMKLEIYWYISEKKLKYQI